MFQWDLYLATLSEAGRPVIEANLNIMNWCLFVFWIMLAYIPIVHSKQMLETAIGKSVMVFIILFWLVRIFILQPLYVGIATRESVITIVIFIVGLSFFLIPLISVILKKVSGGRV